MKFKVGDKVKLVCYRYPDTVSNPLWNGLYGQVKGTVIDTNLKCIDLKLRVKWDNGVANAYEEENLDFYCKHSKEECRACKYRLQCITEGE
jgi:hypothetical protein